jgi:predicted alpha/beta superfamily hydrolase
METKSSTRKRDDRGHLMRLRGRFVKRKGASIMNGYRSLILLMVVVVAVAACQPAEPESVEVPVTVEVTRVVEVAPDPLEPEVVEVTRIVEVPVEVEVTRLVEAPLEQVAPETVSFNPMTPIEFDTIASSATGREYAVTVVLPLTYMMSDADYPVIYVTDGDAYAIPMAMAATQMAFGQEVPEFIVVGVDYGTPNPMEWLELRELDMGPEGREKYLQFFEQELIPTIESAYRVDSANRTLAGHSSGGDFALYGLLNAAGTFNSFIASSPSGAAGLIPNVENFAANQDAAPARLYMSAGDLDTETVASAEAFDEALTEKGFENLDHVMMILDGETHLSARPRAFTSGIRWISATENE